MFLKSKNDWRTVKKKQFDYFDGLLLAEEGVTATHSYRNLSQTQSILDLAETIIHS
jgi:hypothetical protein